MKNAGSPISKNSHTPAKYNPAIIIGNDHNRFTFFPASTPVTTAKKGLIEKNNKKQTAIPILPANVTASHGQPIIKKIANIIQTSKSSCLCTNNTVSHANK